MTPNTIRIIFALFLVAHGWIHMSLAQVPLPQPGAVRTPFFPSWWRDATDPNWPIIKLGAPPEVARTLGWILWVTLVAGYVLAGAMLIFAPAQVALWQSFAAGASIISLLLLIFFWHPWLVLGIAIDLALLGGVFFKVTALRFGH